MSNKKKTAVSWLLNQMDLATISKYDKELLQAKQMEREQIEDAYGDGLNAHRTNFCNRNEYYDQTYGN